MTNIPLIDDPVVVEGTLHQTIYGEGSGCHGTNTLWDRSIDGEPDNQHSGWSISIPGAPVLPTGTKVRVTYELVELGDEPIHTNSWHRQWRKWLRDPDCVCGSDEVTSRQT